LGISEGTQEVLVAPHYPGVVCYGGVDLYHAGLGIGPVHLHIILRPSSHFSMVVSVFNEEENVFVQAI
jgi:hypothetical protein